MEVKQQEQQTVEQDPEKKRRKLDATTVLNLVSYPTAWAAGAVYAWQYVRQESYKVLETLGHLDKPMSGKKGDVSFNEWVHKESDKIKINGEAQKKQAELRRKIEAKKKELFKSMGYKNIYHNWEVIAKNNKVEGAALAVGGAAVALGALLVFANSKSIFSSLFVQDNDNDNDKNKKKSFVDSLADPMAGLVPPDSKTR